MIKSSEGKVSPGDANSSGTLIFRLARRIGVRMLLLVEPFLLLTGGHAAVAALLGRPGPQVRCFVDLDSRFFD